MKQAYRTDVVASLATTQNGAAIKVERCIGAAFQFNWVDGGALDGTLKLQGSNDAFFDNPTAPENPNAIWDDVENSQFNVSGIGHDTIDVTVTDMQALRWVYTAAAGAGSMVVKISIKGRN